MVTSQKCKESKKCATYSIHNFWKQGLSANNYLPSFGDDLNVHKNPDVNKFATLNIIADNFSSLHNNFLKSNGSEQPFISESSNFDSISIPTFVNKSIPKNFTVSNSRIRFCLASSAGVQGKTSVSNSTSISDFTIKRVLSTVPLTNTSCNINSNKKSHPALSYSDTTS